jgi:hypothetical protein
MDEIIPSRKELNKIEVGKYVVDVSSGSIYRVAKIYPDGSYDLEHRWNDEWHQYGHIEKDRRDYVGIDSPDDIRTAYEEVKSNPQLFTFSEVEEDNETTAITIAKPLSFITDAQDDVKRRKLIVKKATAYLAREKNKLDGMIRAMNEKINKMQKVIDAIEMYLGTYHSMVTIVEGATDNGPIYMRQAVLYMDEEYGDPRENPKTGQKGLDWQNVEDFDAWLRVNIDKVLPEKKGILAMKPSRQRREYSDNAFLSASMNENNMMTYLIIRNGENIHRLWTDIVFSSRLFATQHEMQEMFKKLDDERLSSWDREKVVDAEYIYKRNALIIQGLIDRTDLFAPLKIGASLFKPETYEGALELVRDDEMIIDDGHISWREWQKSINDKIGVGSRILMISPGSLNHSYSSTKDYKYNFKTYYMNDWSIPPLPHTGVYQVVEAVERNKHWSSNKTTMYYFKYNPKDTVESVGWDYDPHERKYKISFGIEKDDDYVLNYDQIELKDVEYFVNSRKDKSEYIKYMTFLRELKDALTEEYEKEKHFVKLLATTLGKTEEQVWKAVAWWKFKNKWKRRLDADDAKAYRMISKRLSK